MTTQVLTAGRELDALVADKVMEWERWTIEQGEIPDDGKNRFVVYQNSVYGEILSVIGPAKQGPFWHPSTDIAAAWTVLEKFDAWEIRLLPPGSPRPGVRLLARGGQGEGLAYADTVTEAICLAALKAVGHDH